MTDLNENGLLRISGYASLFGQTDLSGDTIERGAFSGSILALRDARLPMLFGHETKTPIGVWDRVFEDRQGLYVSGRLFADTENAVRLVRLIKERAVSGLSIGYRVKRSRKTSAGRHLLELDLWEVSVVAFPMLRTARITQIDDLTSPTATETGAHIYA